MKIEAKFYSEKNQLYYLNGSKAELNTTKIKAIKVKWSEIGLDEDSYNEEFLATLRDQFKLMEEEDCFAYILPICDNSCDTQEKKEAYVSSIKHCARRIKDCENIIGFEIPEEVDCDFFIEELSAKHKHYIYFTRNVSRLKNNEKIVQY